MKDPRDIILYPIVTEKSLKLRDSDNKYTFCVARDSNKIEIKRAVEELFKVKVLKVNTQFMKGKPKSFRRLEGRRSSYKKAICKLKEGDKIEIFGGT
jgi:large subunit ribosomal protein L23